MKTAGIMAKIAQGIATQIANSRTAISADGNQFSSYIMIQNKGAITQAHWPIHCEIAIILVRS